MRTEYDFSRSRKNPYVGQLKRQITIRLDVAAVEYFKEMAADLGMPYQNLINLFLRDCALRKRRPVIQWPEDTVKPGTARGRKRFSTALPRGPGNPGSERRG